MFRHLREKKKLNKSIAMREIQKFDYDKDGRVIIDVGLKCADDFFSPYSYRTQEIMNPEVESYINEFESCIPADKEIVIDIFTETPTINEEKMRIKQTVKRHHADEVIALNKKLKHNLILGTIFSLIGLLILFAEILVFKLLRNNYLDTVIGIVGWLFLWDGLEIVFYNRRELNAQKHQSYRLMNAKVHVKMYSKTIQREYKMGEFEE